ncbi:MAG TPA: hypothetical protein PLI95_23355, partial [Polyangiaceae bacterium]|nr:hypothetical protein [Polyangiaceae bacterium]
HLVLIPKRNAADIEQIPQEVRDELDIRLIERMDQILPLVLEEPLPSPEPSESHDDDDDDETPSGSGSAG